VHPGLEDPTTGIPSYPELVVRYARDGTELSRFSIPVLQGVSGIAAATDGSCWLAVGVSETVACFLHLAPDGSVLQQIDGAVLGPPAPLEGPPSVAISAHDGSIWLSFAHHVGKLNSSGELMWTVPLDVWALDVDPVSGFAWTSEGDDNQVSIVSNTGQVLWQASGFFPSGRPSINPFDGTCWLGDVDNLQLVHLEVDLTRFNDITYDNWARTQIRAISEAGIVTGFADGTYRPVLAVTRDQMAVYIARALAGGDAYVPTGAHTVTFADVPADHWAFHYVEYCSDANIVAGYDDGYRPAAVVDRAQMAVYVTRSIVDPTGEAGLTGYTPPATASFTDVPTDYWAYKHVEYCKAQSIVSGYGDGYHPEDAVTRDQMAVYVARAFALVP
jgi:hypothetical protein